MSRHRDSVPLHHMLEYAQKARRMASGHRREDLDADEMLTMALTRAVEVVGEAANRISASERKALPQLPWNAIRGTRNRLIHGYDIVDLDVLWDVIELDLPPLIEQLETILSQRDQ